jgi:hypothetical protein
MTVGSKPDMILYAVQEYRSGKEIKKRWTRIGAAWKHGDGAGFNIRQEFVPVSGEEFNLVLREPEKSDGSHETDGETPF